MNTEQIDVKALMEELNGGVDLKKAMAIVKKSNQYVTVDEENIPMTHLANLILTNSESEVDAFRTAFHLAVANVQVHSLRGSMLYAVVNEGDIKSPDKDAPLGYLDESKNVELCEHVAERLKELAPAGEGGKPIEDVLEGILATEGFSFAEKLLAIMLVADTSVAN